MSTTVFVVLGGVLAAIASAIAIWAFFFRTPAQTSQDAASYKGAINSATEQQRFIEFTSKHDGDIVRLDVWMHADMAKEIEKRGSREVSYFAIYFECPETAGEQSIEAGCTGMEYGVSIDPAGDAWYGYNQGANYLRGYFTVRANPGMHQGYLSTSLVSVRREDAP